MAVEFAMTLPLLILLVFSILELSHANMVLNSIEAAAYEGARRGILPGATVTDCVDAAEESLRISRVRNATVSVTPGDLVNNRTANEVEVTITAIYGQNNIVAPKFTSGLTFVRRCRLQRE